MTKPVRIPLSRRKGFNLQAASVVINGLPAVSVARPTKFGNPFSISFCEEWFSVGPAAARAKAVELFRQWMAGELDKTWTSTLPPALEDLRGKNLACWCSLDKPCHADVLLELANR